MGIKQLEGGRAAYAYTCAEDGAKISEKKEIGNNQEYYQDKQYKSYTKKIPMMIKTNGLGNALAFIFSKKTKPKKDNNNTLEAGDTRNPKNAYDLLYKQIQDWLKKDINKHFLENKTNEDLVKAVIQLDSSKYRAVTVEVLALFGWLKRFSEGLIDGEDENE